MCIKRSMHNNACINKYHDVHGNCKENAIIRFNDFSAIPAITVSKRPLGSICHYVKLAAVFSLHSPVPPILSPPSIESGW